MPASDLDLVLETSADERAALMLAVGVQKTDPRYPADSNSIRFGKLNLILPPSPAAVDVWRLQTEILKSRKPVSRDEAVATIKAALAAIGEGES